MKNIAFTLALLIGSGLAHIADAADCYADYQAKRDNPLRLQYGVAEISQCSRAGAEAELRQRLQAHGWTLLKVVSVFDKNGLAERKESAGPNYLRF